MKKPLKITVALLVLLIAAGLFLITYYPRLAQNILIPEIEHLRSADLELKGDSAFARINLRLHNKGPFKMNLDSIIYKINFDTLRVLSKAQDLSIVLKSGEADTFKLPVAVPVNRIKDRILELQDRDSADIVTDLRLVYSTVFGRVSLPHKKTSRIGMIHPPDYEIEKIEYVGRDGKKLQLRAHLKFLFKGKKVLQVSQIRYTMKVADLIEAEGAHKETINIIPRVAVRKALPIEVELKRPLRTAFLVLTDDDILPYDLKVSLKITGSEVVDESEITVRKKGKLELKK